MRIAASAMHRLNEEYAPDQPDQQALLQNIQSRFNQHTGAGEKGAHVAPVMQARVAEEDLNLVRRQLSPNFNVTMEIAHAWLDKESAPRGFLRFTNFGFTTKRLYLYTTVDGVVCRALDSSEYGHEIWEAKFPNEEESGYGFPRYFKIGHYDGMNLFQESFFEIPEEFSDPIQLEAPLWKGCHFSQPALKKPPNRITKTYGWDKAAMWLQKRR